MTFDAASRWPFTLSATVSIRLSGLLALTDPKMQRVSYSRVAAWVLNPESMPTKQLADGNGRSCCIGTQCC
jgi:hypothetical protein